VNEQVDEKTKMEQLKRENQLLKRKIRNSESSEQTTNKRGKLNSSLTGVDEEEDGNQSAMLEENAKLKAMLEEGEERTSQAVAELQQKNEQLQQQIGDDLITRLPYAIYASDNRHDPNKPENYHRLSRGNADRGGDQGGPGGGRDRAGG
jgi:uncharacterized membrane protein YgaE (UPF0421/DUF939 family)